MSSTKAPHLLTTIACTVFFSIIKTRLLVINYMYFTDSDVSGIESGLTLLASAPFIVIGLILFLIPNIPGVSYWSRRRIYGLVFIILGFITFFWLRNMSIYPIKFDPLETLVIIIIGILILLPILVISFIVRTKHKNKL